MRFENLNITGVNGCTSTQFDTFLRSVGPGWGFATPSGYHWTNEGTDTATTGADDGSGYILTAGTGTFQSTPTVLGDGPWRVGSDFTFRTVLTLYAVNFAFPGTGIVISSGAGAGGHVNIVPRTSGLIDIGVGDGNGTTFESSLDLDWAVGVASDLSILWENSPTQAVSRVKVWPSSDPEPVDWTATRVWTPVDGPYTEGFGIRGVGVLSGGQLQAIFAAMDFDYDGRPCTACDPIIDDFANLGSIPYDCVNQTVDYDGSQGAAPLRALTSRGAQVIGGSPLVIEFRANSSDGDNASFSYVHDYGDDDRCDLNVAAAVGGSLVPYPAFPGLPERHVVGGTSVTTGGAQVTSLGGDPTDCGGNFTASFEVTVNKELSSYTALLPEPGHLGSAYGTTGNTTQEFFPTALIQFMGLFGFSLGSDGDPDQAFIGSESTDFTIGAAGAHNIRAVVENGIGSLWVWAVGDPQPSTPLLTADVTSFTPLYKVFVQQSQFSDDDFVVTIANGAVAGSSAPSVDVPSPPSSGFGFEYPTFNGGVTYQLSHQLVAETTRVWVNGHQLRKGVDYVEHPAAGTIEIIDDTLEPSDVVYVEYHAVGGVGDPVVPAPPVTNEFSGSTISALQTFIDGLPNGSPGAPVVIGLPAAGTLTGSSSDKIQMDGRSWLTFVGRSCALVRSSRGTTPIWDLRAATHDLRFIQVITEGQNPGEHTVTHEHEHGFSVFACYNIEIDSCSVINVGGDGVDLSGSDSFDKWSDNVYVHDSLFDGCGRSGASFTDGINNARIYRNTYRNCYWYTWDFEPNGLVIDGRAAGNTNIDIQNNVLEEHPFGLLSDPADFAAGVVVGFTGSSGGGPVQNVTVQGTTMTEKWFTAIAFDNGVVCSNLSFINNAGPDTFTASINGWDHAFIMESVNGLTIRGINQPCSPDSDFESHPGSTVNDISGNTV